MAEVDRRLLGNGFPEKVPLRNIDPEYHAMGEFIEKHVRAELAMVKPRRTIEQWYEQNKFWVWLIPIVVAVASLAVELL